MRAFTSYSKVQSFLSLLLRNRRLQVWWNQLHGKRFLDLGCGPNIHQNFVNVDFYWKPGVNLCWDIQKPLPFQNETFQGVFTEHCLEHFPLQAVRRILHEMKRILQPGGVMRIVVPDGELYMRTYVNRLDGGEQRFPFEAAESKQTSWVPIQSVNRIFYQDRESLFGHRCMYDFPFLNQLLAEAGFSDVRKCRFGEGSVPSLLIEQKSRECESLYVEASIPKQVKKASCVFDGVPD